MSVRQSNEFSTIYIHFFLSEQSKFQSVISFIEKSVESGAFVVPLYARTSVELKELDDLDSNVKNV
jgi:hypothetical protein